MKIKYAQGNRPTRYLRAFYRLGLVEAKVALENREEPS